MFGTFFFFCLCLPDYQDFFPTPTLCGFIVSSLKVALLSKMSVLSPAPPLPGGGARGPDSQVLGLVLMTIQIRATAATWVKISSPAGPRGEAESIVELAFPAIHN